MQLTSALRMRIPKHLHLQSPKLQNEMMMLRMMMMMMKEGKEVVEACNFTSFHLSFSFWFMTDRV